MPALKFQSLSGGGIASLASCPTAKCLTVYVAPWCPYCRAAKPQIEALIKFLDGNGVSSRVIVGMDRPEAVRAYAESYGPETLLDPAGKLAVEGVPHFFVSNRDGKILKEVSGFPEGPGSSQELASVFNLP